MEEYPHSLLSGSSQIIHPKIEDWLRQLKKIPIAYSDHLSDSWSKAENLRGLDGSDVEFVNPSANDGEYGIVAVQLTTPTGSVDLD